MNLRELAESDLEHILEDDIQGGAESVTLTNPAGGTGCFNGFDFNIGEIYDPQSDTMVAGQLRQFSLRQSTLCAAGMAIPEGVADEAKKPWLVRHDRTQVTSKVKSVLIDGSLGISTVHLEPWVSNAS